MATAGSVIQGALRLIGALAQNETLSAAQSENCLAAFNAMLSSWSTERLSVYATQDQQFSWPSNTATRTLGPTGDFVGERPILVNPATYFKVNGVSYGLQLINQQQYDDIALKTVSSTFPQVMWVNMTHPNISMTLYPVPATTLDMHIISVLPLSEPALVSTELAFPPGYERAMRFNLACELAPEFGTAPSPQVARIADVSKRTLKRINNPNDYLSMPYQLVQRNQRFNIFTGGY